MKPTPARTCALCRTPISVLRRSDVKFCSSKCRQQDYRFRQLRAGLTEVAREDADLANAALPAKWASLRIVSVTYDREVSCVKCGQRTTEVLSPVRRVDDLWIAFFFCSEDCLLDVAHSRPPD